MKVDHILTSNAYTNDSKDFCKRIDRFTKLQAQYFILETVFNLC